MPQTAGHAVLPVVDDNTRDANGKVTPGRVFIADMRLLCWNIVGNNWL